MGGTLALDRAEVKSGRVEADGLLPGQQPWGPWRPEHSVDQARRVGSHLSRGDIINDNEFSEQSAIRLLLYRFGMYTHKVPACNSLKTLQRYNVTCTYIHTHQ